jgi:hypothetical protein
MVKSENLTGISKSALLQQRNIFKIFNPGIYLLLIFSLIIETLVLMIKKTGTA